ncbi:hypothetical protein [Rickettsia endosymbiont of Cardiosporidium cionae]|uniref:hypothetical protein n=1 Tax=Rickettsia endosymbiont of Cardiosporidium cionae TaxID=2777155 RepID=UPI0018962D58|nr:hypothetical protein [Rickettsia endosymbiont of Cardiosporidium cionae]
MDCSNSGIFSSNSLAENSVSMVLPIAGIRFCNSTSLNIIPVMDNKDIKQSDNLRLIFIKNESKILMLDNDDVVLGKVTRKAYLELIDYSAYINIFWKNYIMLQNFDKKQAIEKFIDNYK